MSALRRTALGNARIRVLLTLRNACARDVLVPGAWGRVRSCTYLADRQ